MFGEIAKPPRQVLFFDDNTSANIHLCEGTFLVKATWRIFPPSAGDLMLMSAFVAGLLAASTVQAGETSLWRLYEKRDFFSLQRELPTPSSSDSPKARFLRAQTYSAFGEYNRANP